MTETTSIFWGLDGPQIVVTLLPTVMIIGGFWAIDRIKGYSHNVELNQRVIQLLGLCFILPTLMLLVAFTEVKAESIVAILGSLIGYVFGTYQANIAAMGKDKNLDEDAKG